MFLILALGLVISTATVNGSMLATVCPTSQMANSNMRSLYRHAVCQNSQVANCTRIDSKTIGFSYAGFTILLYNGEESERVAEVTRRLSKCGVSFSLVDISRKRAFEGANVMTCPNGAAAIILDIGGGTYFNQLIGVTDTDCAATYIQADHPLAMFYKACPNTLWLAGDTGSICARTSAEQGSAGSLVHVNVPSQNVTHLSSSQYEPDDRLLLRGKVLKVGTVPSGPFAARTNGTNGTTVFKGVVFELLDRIAANLSFQYTLVEPSDGQYGLLEENGVYTGLVGMLQRREIDLVAADLTVAYNRSRVIDYAPTAFFFEAIGIMITEPVASQPLWQWTSPFDHNVWLVLLAAVVIVSSILYLAHVFQCVYVAQRFARINDCLWHVGTGLLSQGLDFSPASWWGQTLLSFWWLLCLAVIAAYSGNLVAMLTTDSVELPLNTFEDLSKLVGEKQYRVCVQNGTSIYDELLNGAALTYVPIRKFLRDNAKYVRPSTADCVQLMAQDDKLALIQEVNQLEDYQRAWCKNRTFIILNDRFYSSYFAFGFQKGSPFMSAFSVPMLEAVESGLIGVWKRIYTTRVKMCQVVEPNTSVRAAMKPLELNDFVGVILIFGIGAGTGLLLLILEKMRQRRYFHSFPRLPKPSRATRRADPVEVLASSGLKPEGASLKKPSEELRTN